MSTNVIYYINDKCLIQGRRLGDDRLEVFVLLVALGELSHVADNWAAVEYPQKEQEEKSRVGKSEYITCTQQV